MNLNLKIIRVSIKYESVKKHHILNSISWLPWKLWWINVFCSSAIVLFISYWLEYVRKIKGLAGQTSIGYNSSLLYVVQIQTCNLSSQSLKSSIAGYENNNPLIGEEIEQSVNGNNALKTPTWHI